MGPQFRSPSRKGPDDFEREESECLENGGWRLKGSTCSYTALECVIEGGWAVERLRSALPHGCLDWPGERRLGITILRDWRNDRPGRPGPHEAHRAPGVTRSRTGVPQLDAASTNSAGDSKSQRISRGDALSGLSLEQPEQNARFHQDRSCWPRCEKPSRRVRTAILRDPISRATLEEALSARWFSA